MELSPRQSEILDYIIRFIREEGWPPTRAEITEYFGFASPNAAQCHLKALAGKGAIRIESGTARGIVPLCGPGDDGSADPTTALSLPLIGQVAAGSPILAIENREEQVSVPRNLFRPVPDYLLRVRGESMIDAGIEDGDLLAVQRTATASHGQIVVVRIGDEVTVKRLRRRGRGVWLEAANPEFADRQLTAADGAVIEGRAVGVIRRL